MSIPIIIISNLPINRNLDPGDRLDPGVGLRAVNEDAPLALGDAGLAIGICGPVSFGFGAHLVEGVGVRRVRGEVGGHAGAGGDNVGGAGGACSSGRVEEGEGAAVGEGTAHREDDAEGHGGGEDCSHAG